MRKSAWLIIFLLIGMLYFLSSIPGLRVLPVLGWFHSFLMNFDHLFVWVSQRIADQLPLDYSQLSHMDTLTRDVMAYTRENPIIIEFFLRKMAHVIVFFVITIALFFLLYQYIRSSALAVLLAFIGGFLLAVLDEYHQSLVDGRVGSAMDVVIDMIGVTLATLLIIFSLILTASGRKKREKTEGTNNRRGGEKLGGN
ncbi:VanZ family protein [Desulfitispora alkaliphila]|uniref:VanZ family protein n=1 Tax=Desulfitispora alkaliphila TaxID=622674 RepID=UPI003D20B71B